MVLCLVPVCRTLSLRNKPVEHTRNNRRISTKSCLKDVDKRNAETNDDYKCDPPIKRVRFSTKTTVRINAIGSSYQEEDIEPYLAEPFNHDDTLQDASEAINEGARNEVDDEQAGV